LAQVVFGPCWLAIFWSHGDVEKSSMRRQTSLWEASSDIRHSINIVGEVSSDLADLSEVNELKQELATLVSTTLRMLSMKSMFNEVGNSGVPLEQAARWLKKRKPALAHKEFESMDLEAFLDSHEELEEVVDANHACSKLSDSKFDDERGLLVETMRVALVWLSRLPNVDPDWQLNTEEVHRRVVTFARRMHKRNKRCPVQATWKHLAQGNLKLWHGHHDLLVALKHASHSYAELSTIKVRADEMESWHEAHIEHRTQQQNRFGCFRWLCGMAWQPPKALVHFRTEAPRNIDEAKKRCDRLKMEQKKFLALYGEDVVTD